MLFLIIVGNIGLYAWLSDRVKEVSSDKIVQKAYVVSRLISEAAGRSLAAGQEAVMLGAVREALKDPHLKVVIIKDKAGDTVLETSEPATQGKLSTFNTPILIKGKRVGSVTTSFSFDNRDSRLAGYLKQLVVGQSTLLAVIILIFLAVFLLKHINRTKAVLTLQPAGSLPAPEENDSFAASDPKTAACSGEDLQPLPLLLEWRPLWKSLPGCEQTTSAAEVIQLPGPLLHQAQRCSDLNPQDLPTLPDVIHIRQNRKLISLRHPLPHSTLLLTWQPDLASRCQDAICSASMVDTVTPCLSPDAENPGWPGSFSVKSFYDTVSSFRKAGIITVQSRKRRREALWPLPPAGICSAGTVGRNEGATRSETLITVAVKIIKMVQDDYRSGESNCKSAIANLSEKLRLTSEELLKPYLATLRQTGSSHNVLLEEPRHDEELFTRLSRDLRKNALPDLLAAGRANDNAVAMIGALDALLYRIKSHVDIPPANREPSYTATAETGQDRPEALKELLQHSYDLKITLVNELQLATRLFRRAGAVVEDAATATMQGSEMIAGLKTETSRHEVAAALGAGMLSGLASELEGIQYLLQNSASATTMLETASKALQMANSAILEETADLNRPLRPVNTGNDPATDEPFADNDNTLSLGGAFRQGCGGLGSGSIRE